MACAAVSSCRLRCHSFIFIVPQLIYVPHYSKKSWLFFKSQTQGCRLLRDRGRLCHDASVRYLYLLIFNCYLLKKSKQTIHLYLYIVCFFDIVPVPSSPLSMKGSIIVSQWHTKLWCRVHSWPSSNMSLCVSPPSTYWVIQRPDCGWNLTFNPNYFKISAVKRDKWSHLNCDDFYLHMLFTKMKSK